MLVGLFVFDFPEGIELHLDIVSGSMSTFFVHSHISLVGIDLSVGSRIFTLGICFIIILLAGNLTCAWITRPCVEEGASHLRSIDLRKQPSKGGFNQTWTVTSCRKDVSQISNEAQEEDKILDYKLACWQLISKRKESN